MLRYDDVDMMTFTKALDIWCGRKDCQEMELTLDEVKHLLIVADRFQMMEVLSFLEEPLRKKLSLNMCGDILSWQMNGIKELAKDALTMAAEQFEHFSETPGFVQMGEEALKYVVDADGLASRNEEAVWEAVLRWTRAPGATRRQLPRGVVSTIRFPLMEERYLRSLVAATAPAEDAEWRSLVPETAPEDAAWMESVVAEALRAKEARREGAVFQVELLGRKALTDRAEPGVRWEEYRNGGELRLQGHADLVRSLVECDGRMCSASSVLRVWNKASLELERTLQLDTDEEDDFQHHHVYSLAVWGDHLISGHGGGMLRVWNVATGECEQVLEEHDGPVWALAVCGSQLVSSCEDGSIKVWAMADGAPWQCERDLYHSTMMCSLVGWRDKVVGGSDDGRIRVWDVETGARDATLVGHSSAVWGLAVHRDRLFSASRDGTIREWELGTGALLQTVQVYEPGDDTLNLRCLAISGSKLLSGSWGRGIKGEMRVWGLKDWGLDLQQTLPDRDVYALLARDGEVWGTAGLDVVVWGRRQ